VAEGGTAREARNEALSYLGTAFRVDIKSVTQTTMTFVERMVQVNGKIFGKYEKRNIISEKIGSHSEVSGLIGVQSDTWTAPNGKRVYVNLRMNRAECAARYATIFDASEELITDLIADASKSPASFTAYRRLSFAYELAVVSDNFYIILTVLDPSHLSRAKNYGSAAAVKALMDKAAVAITVNVRPVKGDVDGRIAGALSSFFTTTMGFNVGRGRNAYTLTADFKASNVAMPDPNFKYAQYVLKVAITGGREKTVFAYSGNDRLGGTSAEEAREEVVSGAEESIASGDFAEKFKGYLRSLSE
jgi:hypothetical protein